MPSGYTTTSSLSDSLEYVIASARLVREFDGHMPNLVDRQTLAEGESWNEISLAGLTAQSVSETEKLNNPQQVQDTKFPLTPSTIGIHMLITRKVQKRISSKAYARLGSLAQNAIQRKKDEDGLVVLDGATTSLGGAGTTLNSGIIAAASVRITSNTTEPANPPIYCVLHGYQLKDLYDELTQGIGTYPVPDGETARVFKEGFRGRINNVELFEDGNITIDASDDAKGGVWAKEAIVLVQGQSPWKFTREEVDIGGGSDSVFLYDDYVYGERSAGNWLFESYSDATVPTS